MGCSFSEGILAVVMSATFFGSFTSFIKIPSVMKLELDPVVFQCYKSFFAFASCFLALTVRPFEFTAWGIVSGMSWIPAGIAAIISVRSIGISVGQGLWSGLIILVNCMWGILVFHEDIGNAWITIPGILMLICGVVGISTCTIVGEFLGGLFFGQESKSGRQPLLDPPDKSTSADLEPNTDDSLTKVPSIFPPDQKYPRWVGFAAAIFNGLWGGSIYVPMKIASEQGVKTSGFDYLVSFGIGVGIVQIFILIVYGVIRVTYLNKPFFPDFHFKTLRWAGSAAGIFWSIGNFFSLLAINCLGEAVGFSACQASLLVSGLLGVFLYHEIRGFSIVVFFFFGIITISGVFLMMYGRNS
eukprot:c7945_g1_i1.p1 GENE.c7945_g1_i1~~c7945_g1_i1.p1  ORF type:complete len:383 (+),score=50.22 c7945_g1_i1:82-1149(+)